MTVEIRSVSGYEALERWAEARNAAGPDVVSPHAEAPAQIAATREAGLEAMVAVPKTRPLASLFAELGYEPRKTWLELEGQLT